MMIRALAAYKEKGIWCMLRILQALFKRENRLIPNII